MERLLVAVALASLAAVVVLMMDRAGVDVDLSPLGPLDGAVNLVGAR